MGGCAKKCGEEDANALTFFPNKLFRAPEKENEQKSRKKERKKERKTFHWKSLGPVFQTSGRSVQLMRSKKKKLALHYSLELRVRIDCVYPMQESEGNGEGSRRWSSFRYLSSIWTLHQVFLSKKKVFSFNASFLGNLFLCHNFRQIFSFSPLPTYITGVGLRGHFFFHNTQARHKIFPLITISRLILVSCSSSFMKYDPVWWKGRGRKTGNRGRRKRVFWGLYVKEMCCNIWHSRGSPANFGWKRERTLPIAFSFWNFRGSLRL